MLPGTPVTGLHSDPCTIYDVLGDLVSVQPRLPVLLVLAVGPAVLALAPSVSPKATQQTFTTSPTHPPSPWPLKMLPFPVLTLPSISADQVTPTLCQTLTLLPSCGSPGKCAQEPPTLQLL